MKWRLCSFSLFYQFLMVAFVLFCSLRKQLNFHVVKGLWLLLHSYFCGYILLFWEVLFSCLSFCCWHFIYQMFLLTTINFSCLQRRNRETESPWKVYEAPRTRENRTSKERFRYILESLFIYFGQGFTFFISFACACLYFS